MDVLDAALLYGSFGWCVLPVLGKTPQLGLDWQNKTTNDPLQIKSMFSAWKHDGVGVQLGPKSGIIDIECDDEEAEDEFFKLFDAEVPNTPTFRSTRGLHFLFRWQDGLPEPGKNVFKLGNLEFRTGNGGKAAQTVFPPSGVRKWEVEPTTPTLPLPSRVLERVLLARAELRKRKDFVPIGYSSPRYGDGETLDVPRWLEKHGRDIIGKNTGTDGATRWFIECPNIDLHTTPDAWRDCCVTQEPNGKLGGHCLHQSCGMNDWTALRDSIGPLEYSDFHEEQPPADDVDLSGILNPKPPAPKTSGPVDPELMNPDYYNVPGIIGEFIQYTTSTAPRPRPEIALAAAISLMGVITGRKIRSRSGIRTNIYCIALAASGSGKDWPRKCSRNVLTAAGMQTMLAAENPASDAGLINSLFEQPTSLFQIDEINRYFSSIKAAGAKNSHLTGIFDTLMKLEGESGNAAWAPKGRADSKNNKVVAYPHCCIFGTGTPDGFWGSVQSSDAIDGFLARMLVIEASRNYPRLRETEFLEPPESLVQKVKAWAEFSPGGGILSGIFPKPMIVPFDSAATIRLRNHAESIEDRLQNEPDSHKTIWGRASATAKKLAMIYAASRGPDELIVTIEDANQAIRLVNWCTRLLLRRVFTHVAENEYESKKKRTLEIIRKRTPITMRDLKRGMSFVEGSRRKDEIIRELVEEEEISVKKEDTGGRPSFTVHLECIA